MLEAVSRARGTRWPRALPYFSGWTLLGLFFASRSILIYSYTEDEFDWRLPLVMSLTEWYGWAALAPAVLWLHRRAPIDRVRWRRGLAMHGAASIFFSFVKVGLDSLLMPLATGVDIPVSTPYKFHTNFLTYWAIVGVAVAVAYYRKYRDRELEASRLEVQLTRAQLQVLEMQLHPHFLFNTLHAISTLMHRDADAADTMLSRLSELLRHTLESVGVQEVSLKQELELLDRYLEIEKVRLGDRLRVRVDVEPEVLDARVPNLILQPLVENAVRHGVASRSSGGQVVIRAHRRDGALALEVADDGPGWKRIAGRPPTLGIGLANTSERLRQAYGDTCRFSLDDAVGGGAQVSLMIPLRTRDDVS